MSCGCEPADHPDATAPEKRLTQVGERPYFLIDDMAPSPLKDELAACAGGPFSPTDFSIGHRGAPLQFPEHTRESYIAAARQGAGRIECDVTFTRDRELVCRHAQCDLHTTTNILAIPELAAKCREPFRPADPADGTPAAARCCASDLTTAEFKRLCGKMDAFDPTATTVEAYMGGTPPWRTELYAGCGTLLTHAESVELIEELGAGFIPELKAPEVEMPFEGDYGRHDYARQLVADYRNAGIPPERVWLQSFDYDDVLFWLEHAAEYGGQVIYLDGRYADGLDPSDPATWTPTFEAIAGDGVRIIAPPTWVLVTLDDRQRIVPSAYARAAREAGLEIVTWTLERSGALEGNAGGWYYQSIADAIDRSGDTMELMDVLAREVEVSGIFSDWPATVTYYASCTGRR
ncbi:glycerophosphodiester phosphodiesterase [Acidobacteria bacterium Mor1]|nr:glycerophosphodiester phosphodiesterase [Acidobacteria bacterium Mor1]